MLTKLYTKFYLNRLNRKMRNKMYKTVKFICDDCGKKGLVLRQISILNLACWFVLGAVTFSIMFFLLDIFWVWAMLSGLFILYLCTGINIKLNKPQCRHCLSTNIRLPDNYASKIETPPSEKADHFQA